MATTSDINTFISGVGVGNGGVGNGNVPNVTDSYWAWQPPAPPITYEHTIQGQMFMVEYQTSEFMMASMGDDAKIRIKKEIALNLAEKMLEEGAIAFTQIPDLASGATTIKARCFLVPDNQVRILRTLYKDK
jgi:hypothetical protein